MSHFHKLGNLGKSVWLYRLFQAPPELEHTGGGSCCALHNPLQSEPGTETRGVLTFQTRDAAEPWRRRRWASGLWLGCCFWDPSGEPVDARAPRAASLAHRQAEGLLPEPRIQRHIRRPRHCAHRTQLKRRKQGLVAEKLGRETPQNSGEDFTESCPPRFAEPGSGNRLPKTALSVQKLEFL